MIEIADDGVGGADESAGTGLRGLADRVAALDGHAAHPQPARRRDGGHRGVAVRVVIADDTRLWREGVASLVRDEGIEVVAEAATPDELLAAVDEHRPDVAIVDIRMPPTQTQEGIEAAHELRQRHPGMGIVLLSQHVEVGVALRLLAEAPSGSGTSSRSA